jgi:hypothetical protein
MQVLLYVVRQVMYAGITVRRMSGDVCRYYCTLYVRLCMQVLLYVVCQVMYAGITVRCMSGDVCRYYCTLYVR